MLKKSVLVMFIISMLFMMSCSDDPTSSDPTSNKDRVVELNYFWYSSLDSAWVKMTDGVYDYDIYDRLESTILTDIEESYVSTMEFNYKLPSDLFPEYFMIGNTRINLTYDSGKTKEFTWMFLNEFDVYEEFVKTEYTYENNLLVSAVESYNDSKEWVEMNYESWAYESGRLVDYIETDDERIIYRYENDKLIEKLKYDWMPEWVWYIMEIEEYTYQNELLKEKIIFENISGEFEQSRKEIYEYDGTHLISVLSEYYTGSEWENSYKVEYGYDDRWNFVSRIEYDWDYAKNVFIPEYKYDFTYEEISGNFRDITKALNPELFYTGMSYDEIYFEPAPSKIDNKVKKVLELLEEKK
ncbi:MAG: hypothetical protein GQ534_08015 [Candidatus Delongbacteria bacterium]|nr:hypothetical protein [Candidatus Delongbacteria bacterium]